MLDTEIVEWIKEKKISLPPSDTREIYKYNDDFQVNICNLNVLSQDGVWMVTFETNFSDDDIEIWNGFLINKDKQIVDYNEN